MEEEETSRDMVCDDEEYWSAEEEGFTDCFSHEPNNTQESIPHHVLTQGSTQRLLTQGLTQPLLTQGSTQPLLTQGSTQPLLTQGSTQSPLNQESVKG